MLSNFEDDYVIDEDEGVESDKKKNNKIKVVWSIKLFCIFDIYNFYIVNMFKFDLCLIIR